MTSSPYLVVAQVAERLHCSTRTVHELTRNRAIPHRVISGTRRCLFLADELAAWEAGAALEVVELPRGGRVVRPESGTRAVRAGRHNREAMRLVEGEGDSQSQSGGAR